MKHAPEGPRIEQRDVDVSRVVLYGLILAAIVGSVMIAMGFLFRFLREHDVVAPANQPQVVTRSEMKAPRLQVHEASDLASRVRKERDELNSYGWVDRNAGAVRIPIDRAIELTLQRGLPARSQSGQEKTK